MSDGPLTFRIFIVWATILKSFIDGRPPAYEGHAALWLLDGTNENLPAAKAHAAICGHEGARVFCIDAEFTTAKREAQLWAQVKARQDYLERSTQP